MAFKPGYVAWFGLDNAAGTLTNVQPYADNTDMPQNVEMLEVSAFGTAAKAFIAGLNGGQSITLSGPMDTTLHQQVQGMLAAQDAGTASFSFAYGPGGSVSGQPWITGECLVASYQLTNGVGGRAEYSVSLQQTGALTNATL